MTKSFFLSCKIHQPERGIIAQYYRKFYTDESRIAQLSAFFSTFTKVYSYFWLLTPESFEEGTEGFGLTQVSSQGSDRDITGFDPISDLLSASRHHLSLEFS
ncbi:MAG: hypothetical protein GVY04_05970 [Cyanobacteria bacterium]|nr:hypothetical protein [Cyanobacteria bacterium GSL.Bin1]